MVKDPLKNDLEYEDIYRIETKRKIDKNKLVIVILIIIALLASIGIGVYSVNIIKDYRNFKKEEEKILAIKKEEEQQQADKKTEEEMKEAEKERIRKERIPQLTQVGIDNMKNIYKSEYKRVFLTFDDGPSKMTTSILDVLKQENVPATFFVLGSKVEIFPETTKRIYDEGHYLANHGYSHVYSTIYSSPQAVLDEFNRCNDLVKNAIQVPEYNSHLFRFPGGFTGGRYADIKRQAHELLEQNNILNIDWNALTGDAEVSEPNAEFLLQKLIDTSQNKNSLIVLIHDTQNKPAILEALPQIIGYLRGQGYEFENFYKIMK